MNSLISAFCNIIHFYLFSMLRKVAQRMFRILSSSLREHNYRFGSVSSLDSFLLRNNIKASNESISCDLGCGSKIRNPFGAGKVIGIDSGIDLGKQVISSNLVLEPIPLESNSISFVSAYDLIEHIPRILCLKEGKLVYPFLNIMDEIYRVLKPGGYFFSSSPAYPSPVAFQDPTHVNIITEETFPVYFCREYNDWIGSDRPVASIYGFQGCFDLVDQAWWGDHMCIAALLKKSSCS